MKTPISIEQKRANGRKYYQEHREAICASKRKWYNRNKHKKAAYYLKNREAIVARRKASYEAKKTLLTA